MSFKFSLSVPNNGAEKGSLLTTPKYISRSHTSQDLLRVCRGLRPQLLGSLRFSLKNTESCDAVLLDQLNGGRPVPTSKHTFIFKGSCWRFSSLFRWIIKVKWISYTCHSDCREINTTRWIMFIIFYLESIRTEPSFLSVPLCPVETAVCRMRETNGSHNVNRVITTGGSYKNTGENENSPQDIEWI